MTTWYSDMFLGSHWVICFLNVFHVSVHVHVHVFYCIGLATFGLQMDASVANLLAFLVLQHQLHCVFYINASVAFHTHRHTPHTHMAQIIATFWFHTLLGHFCPQFDLLWQRRNLL